MQHQFAFTPHRGPTTLRGFLDITVPDLGIEVRGCMLHERNGSRWITFPGIPQLKGGSPILTLQGKPAYKPVVLWSGPTWKGIEARVIADLMASHPDAFDRRAA